MFSQNARLMYLSNKKRNRLKEEIFQSFNMIKHNINTDWILNLSTNFSTLALAKVVLSSGASCQLGLFLSTSPLLMSQTHLGCSVVSAWVFQGQVLSVLNMWFWVQVVIDLFCSVKYYILFEALGPNLKGSEEENLPWGSNCTLAQNHRCPIYWLICSEAQAVLLG